MQLRAPLERRAKGGLGWADVRTQVNSTLRLGFHDCRAGRARAAGRARRSGRFLSRQDRGKSWSGFRPAAATTLMRGLARRIGATFRQIRRWWSRISPARAACGWRAFCRRRRRATACRSGTFDNALLVSPLVKDGVNFGSIVAELIGTASIDLRDPNHVARWRRQDGGRAAQDGQRVRRHRPR